MIRRIKKHKVASIIIALIVVIGIVAGVMFWKGKQRMDKTFAGMKTQSSSLTLEKMDLTESISATGTIESSKTKTISASINDVEVKKVHVKVGDTVKKGATLVTFDKSDLQSNLSEAQETLSDAIEDGNDSIASAQEKLSDAREEYTDAKEDALDDIEEAKEAVKTAKTSEEKEMAKKELETARENKKSTLKQKEDSIESAQDAVKSAQSNKEKSVKEAQKQVDEIQDSLEKCVVKATISGTVTALGVEAGDSYSGGTLVQIDDTSSYQVTTTVDEYDISKVEEGQRVVILTEATDEDELEGEITFVAPSTNSTTISQSESGGMSSSSSSSGYEVQIAITSKDDRLRMGLTAKCSIILEEVNDVFAVPYDAIKESRDGSATITVEDESEESGQKEIAVTKGMESDYYVEISGEGLEEGMKVIMSTDVTASENSESDKDESESGFGGMPGGGSMPGGGEMPSGGMGGDRSGGGMGGGRSGGPGGM